MKDINKLAKKIADRYGIETYDKSKQVKYPPHWIISKEDRRILDTNIEFYKSGIIQITIATNFDYDKYWMGTNTVICISYDKEIVNLHLIKLFPELEFYDFNTFSSSFISCDDDELTLQLTPNALLN